MNGWRDVTLGDVCELKRGYDLPNGSRRDGRIPVVSSSGPTGWHDEAKVSAPGVVTGRYGTLGQVFYLAEDFWPLNTSLYVRDFKGNDPRFVAVLLRSLDLARYDGAAAVPGLNRNHLHTLPVRVPDLPAQSVIAQVNRVFDDLIENHRRRVEVLEEMARAIYREWFVKFRYPGYEDVPLVGSALGPIPEEWTVRRLDELATFVGGSTRTKAAYVDAGYVAFSAAGPDGFVPDYEVDGPGVVLSAVGAKCGRTFWASGKWSSIANTIKILPKEPELFANWLRFATDDSSVWPKRGSAQPFVSINDARGVLSRVATRETHLRFEDAVKPMVDQAVVLEAGARGLAALRDLLLPKLVTGQIDVTSLDLDAAIAEQVA